MCAVLDACDNDAYGLVPGIFGGGSGWIAWTDWVEVSCSASCICMDMGIICVSRARRLVLEDADVYVVCTITVT